MFSAKASPIWIVSDIRRNTDIEFFKKTYGKKIKTVRINASEIIRKNRGWVYVKGWFWLFFYKLSLNNSILGVDDVASECDLDNYRYWDLEVSNEGSDDEICKVLELLKEKIDNVWKIYIIIIQDEKIHSIFLDKWLFILGCEPMK